MAFVNEKKLALQKLLTRVEFARLNSKSVDKKALDLAEKLDLSVVERFDYETTRRYMGTTLCIDEMVEDYVKYNPNACVITVNSGLTTRKSRIERQNSIWYSFDSQDMTLYKQSLKFRNVLSYDLLNEEWLDKVNQSCPGL